MNDNTHQVYMVIVSIQKLQLSDHILFLQVGLYSLLFISFAY